MSIEIKKIEAIEVSNFSMGLFNREYIGTDIYTVDDIVKITANGPIDTKPCHPFNTIVGRIVDVDYDCLRLDVSKKYRRNTIDIPFDQIYCIEKVKEE